MLVLMFLSLVSFTHFKNEIRILWSLNWGEINKSDNIFEISDL